ncbi:MAG: hypothetical protein ACTHNZ_24545, partial [Trinickia sp.]|uniref:hypothetical protein n=1 Tax=Trinickia sp. TaxID=2571163 RepID=UPI003F8042FD
MYQLCFKRDSQYGEAFLSGLFYIWWHGGQHPGKYSRGNPVSLKPSAFMQALNLSSLSGPIFEMRVWVRISDERDRPFRDRDRRFRQRDRPFRERDRADRQAGLALRMTSTTRA